MGYNDEYGAYINVYIVYYRVYCIGQHAYNIQFEENASPMNCFLAAWQWEKEREREKLFCRNQEEEIYKWMKNHTIRQTLAQCSGQGHVSALVTAGSSRFPTIIICKNAYKNTARMYSTVCQHRNCENKLYIIWCITKKW